MNGIFRSKPSNDAVRLLVLVEMDGTGRQAVMEGASCYVDPAVLQELWVKPANATSEDEVHWYHYSHHGEEYAFYQRFDRQEGNA